MHGANLNNSNLSCTNLSCAYLIEANLNGAKLNYSDLSLTNFYGASLNNSDLSGANLSEANLEATSLNDVDCNFATSFFALQCPQEGSFIGFKRADNHIIKLLILEDSLRSSSTTRKCRCSKAKVLSIIDSDGNNVDTVTSEYDSTFIYTVNEIIEVKDFDTDRWKEYGAKGIYFYITEIEAKLYR